MNFLWLQSSKIETTWLSLHATAKSKNKVKPSSALICIDWQLAVQRRASFAFHKINSSITAFCLRQIANTLFALRNRVPLNANNWNCPHDKLSGLMKRRYVRILSVLKAIVYFRVTSWCHRVQNSDEEVVVQFL